MVRIACIVLAAATFLGLGFGGSAARAGAPFITDDPATTEQGHFEIDLAATYKGRQGDSLGALPSLEIDYGASPVLQLHLLAPVAYQHRAEAGLKFGYGDTEFGAKLRVLEEDPDGWRPAVAFFPLVLAPTGRASEGLGSGRLPAVIPLWLGKRAGDWSLFGGTAYAINPGPGNRNCWQTGLGATRAISERLSLGGEVFRSSACEKARPDGGGFNLGGTYGFTSRHRLLVSVGRGVSNAQATNRLSAYVAYQLLY